MCGNKLGRGELRGMKTGQTIYFGVQTLFEFGINIGPSSPGCILLPERELLVQ